MGVQIFAHVPLFGFTSHMMGMQIFVIEASSHNMGVQTLHSSLHTHPGEYNTYIHILIMYIGIVKREIRGGIFSDM